MAYKKYIKKDGKLYGPYVYQSRRIDGKVVSEYCGTDKPNYKKIAIFVFGILILIALVSSFFIFKGKITGNVISDNQLSSQTENNLVNEPETINYPIVYFTLISRQTEKSSDAEPVVNDNGSLIDENLEMPFNDTNDSLNEDIPSQSDSSEKDIEQIPETISSETDVSAKPVVEEQPLAEESQQSTESVPTEEAPQESAPDETSQEPSATITGGVISKILKTASNFFLGLKLTGNAVSESGPIEINGQASADKPFMYNLKEGETIQILSGSVKTNSKSLSDDAIKIAYQSDNVLVTTDYSESIANVPNEDKVVIDESKQINNSKKNETQIEFIEPVSLTEQEKQILLTQFGNISVQTIKSELFNGRYVIGYEFGGYKIEYSYDADLSEAVLKSQMEKDRISWLKNIADKLLETESVHAEANQFNSDFLL
ncbi:MAG: hypothetical protein AABW47_01865 [Nanoarchaeota archaeon]